MLGLSVRTMSVMSRKKQNEPVVHLCKIQRNGGGDKKSYENLKTQTPEVITPKSPQEMETFNVIFIPVNDYPRLAFNADSKPNVMKCQPELRKLFHYFNHKYFKLIP